MRSTILACCALAVCALAGCDAFRPAGCDVCTTSATLSGRVADATGSPVAEASVAIAAFRESCDGRERHIFLGETGSPGAIVTEVDGTFSARLRSPESPGPTCLRVEVVPPGDSGLESATVEGIMVRFADDYPRESRAAVDVQLTLTSGAEAAGTRHAGLTTR